MIVVFIATVVIVDDVIPVSKTNASFSVGKTITGLTCHVVYHGRTTFICLLIF